jgi:hypothetical protein
MTNRPLAWSNTNAPPAAQETDVFFAPSVFQTLFWKPHFLPDTSTVTHLPLLFWLSMALQPQRVAVIGCDDGAAHFAFCQALEKLGHTAQCRGLGFWPDVETGGAPPAPLTKHEAMLYDGLSKLAPCASLDAALDCLGAGAVDLLFADLEAIPKEAHVSGEALFSCIASPGIMLLHGTNNLRQRASDGRALRRFVQNSRYVEFPADKGLMLIVSGDDFPAPLQSLIEHPRGGRLRSDIELVFRRSGQGLKEAAQAESRAQSLQRNEKALLAVCQELQATREELDCLRGLHDMRCRDLAETQRELFELRSEIEKSNVEAEAERSIRDEDRAALARNVEDLRSELAAVGTKLDTAHTEHRAAREALYAQTRAVEELRSEFAKAQAESSARGEVAAAQTRIAQDLRSNLASVQAEREAARQEHAAAKKALDAHMQGTKKLRVKLAEIEAERDAERAARFEETSALTRIAEELR